MAKRNLRLLSFWLLIVPYVVIFYASLVLTIAIRYPQGLNDSAWNNHLIAFSFIYLGWLVIFYVHSLFEIITLRNYRLITINLVSAMTINLVLAVTYFYFQPELILTPRRFLLLHYGISLLLLLIWLGIVKYLLNRRLVENVYLVGDSSSGLVSELQKYDLLGLRIAGTINSDNLQSLAKLDNASIVIPDQTLHGDVLRQFYAMRTQSLAFYNYKDLYENLSRKIYLPSLNELWFLENINYHDKRFYRFIKRLVDLLAGIVGFGLFLLSYLPVAILIKLSSAGPALFTQPRVGKYGTIFTVYKYRTMRGEVHNTWTDLNDSRITGVGKILRRLRIDELPQCLNLLKGNMSLVGPRPEQPHIVAQLAAQIPFYNERHLVKPGLTGWGQLNVYARSVEETKIKLQYDLYYIKHRSLGFDLEIILKTFYHIFSSNSH